MDAVTVNRAPVLTLWAAVVAERLGFDHDEALTLGKAVAGLTAQSKGRHLGIFTPSPVEVHRKRAEKVRAAGVFHVALMGRAVPVLHTDEGLRAADRDQTPVSPESVEKYLASKFGQTLPVVRLAMEKWARSREPEALAEEGFRLYEKFRPRGAGRRVGMGSAGGVERQEDRAAGSRGLSDGTCGCSRGRCRSVGGAATPNGRDSAASRA